MKGKETASDPEALAFAAAELRDLWMWKRRKGDYFGGDGQEMYEVNTSLAGAYCPIMLMSMHSRGKRLGQGGAHESQASFTVPCDRPRPGAVGPWPHVKLIRSHMSGACRLLSVTFRMWRRRQGRLRIPRRFRPSWCVFAARWLPAEMLHAHCLRPHLLSLLHRLPLLLCFSASQSPSPSATVPVPLCLGLSGRLIFISPCHSASFCVCVFLPVSLLSLSVSLPPSLSLRPSPTPGPLPEARTKAVHGPIRSHTHTHTHTHKRPGVCLSDNNAQFLSPLHAPASA